MYSSALLYLPTEAKYNQRLSFSFSLTFISKGGEVQAETFFLFVLVFVLFFSFDNLFLKEARYKEGLSDLSRKQREAIKCTKKNSEEEVFKLGSRFLSIIETSNQVCH